VADSDGAAPAVWAMGRAGRRPAAGVDGGRAGRRWDCVDGAVAVGSDGAVGGGAAGQWAAPWTASTAATGRERREKRASTRENEPRAGLCPC
jgi:hypothetical protein